MNRETRRGRHDAAAKGVGGATILGWHRLRDAFGELGVGVITFSLGVVVLGLDRLRVAQSRPDRAVGWVLVLCGVLTMMFTAIRMAIGLT